MRVRYHRLYARATRSSPRRSSGKRRSFMPILAALGVILLILLARVYLGRDTIRTGMEWERKSRQLRTASQESENLRVERESYLRGDYIRVRAAALGLRQPAPGQVRLMQPTRPAANGLLASTNN